jgi:hypothetical protein
MATQPSAVHLRICVDAGHDASPDDLDQLTRQLRGELSELDLESVDLLKAGQAPPGAKSAEAIALGSLWIALLPTMIPKLIEFLQSWSLRGQDRTVKIKANVGDRAVEVEYAPTVTSDAQVKSLVETITNALAQPATEATVPGSPSRA